MEHLFCTLDSGRIADIIRSAERFVCYAAPGLQLEPAQAMVEVSERLDFEMISVAIDFDERVIRMGFGDLKAVELLRSAQIKISDAPGLRTALILVDDNGYLFTPTALYLEAEPEKHQAPNAMRLSKEQLKEALARLSPVAKRIVVAQTQDKKEQERLASVPIEIGQEPVTEDKFLEVTKSLEEAPPVKFDVARQVRVFNAYLQYVELNLKGVAIQKRRLAIPPMIRSIGGDEIERRLRTTFELIEKDGRLSSKTLEGKLNQIRSDLTPSLGKDYGRVLLKSKRRLLEERLARFRSDLEAHQEKVAQELEEQLTKSKEQVIEYYVPLVMENPPDAMLGRILQAKPTKREVRSWLSSLLDKVFPDADALVSKMQLDVRFKDMTFDTLNEPGFLEAVQTAFPDINWEKAYSEFRAAGESRLESLSGH